MTPRDVSRSPSRRIRFVGRQRELAVLDERLEAAARGEGSVVFISGEPGIGKSRLLAEFAALAQKAGWLVLAGRAYDTEGMPPYLPLLEAIRQHVGAVGSDELLQQLAQGAPEVILIPDQDRGRFAPVAVGLGPGPELERYRLFGGVSAFLLGLATSAESRGLLLCVDDLHWADRSTLLLFQHLARKLGSAPLLVAGTFRSTELEQTHPLSSVLAELTRERLQQTITLPALTPEECAALISLIAAGPVDAVVAQTICERTEGNPFFVEEVVRQLMSESRDLARPEAVAGAWAAPEGVRAVISHRVSRLTTSAQRLLQAAAVLGDQVAPELVRAMIELPEDALVASFEEASAAGMLREEGAAYVFGHALMRQVIYDGLSLARRQQLHARAAEALESRKGPDPQSALAAIGHHWRQAGQPARAVGHLLRAGDAAITLTAWEDAAKHWGAALECMEETGEPPVRRARLLEGLGDLYFLSGFDIPASVERYERASALYDSASDRIAAARARLRAGTSLAYPAGSANYAGALVHLRAAEKIFADQPECVELGEVYAALAHAQSHVLGAKPDQMLAAMARLEEIAEKLGNDFLRVLAYSVRGHFLGHQGRLAQGLALEEQACERAATLKGSALNQWPECWHELLLGYSSTEGPATEGATFQASRPLGHPLIENWMTNCCGVQSYELLDPARARAKHERIRDVRGHYLSYHLPEDLFLCGDTAALRQAVETGALSVGAAGVWAQLMQAWCEGHWTDALNSSMRGVEQSRGFGSNMLLMHYNRRLVRLYRTLGDAKAAENAAQECLEIALSSASVKYEFAARAELALLCAEARRLGEAELHLRRCREILAGGEDWRGLAGRLQLAEAVYAGAQGHREEADAQFERALEVFRDLSLPWDEAEAFELRARSCARFHRRGARRAFVKEMTDSARAIYERLGAGRPWLDRLAAEESRLLGRRAASGAPVYPNGLSQREVEVLRLIAAGRSNKQIADELVLSIRTVERHINHLYAKTGAHTKAQATAYALREGLASEARRT